MNSFPAAKGSTTNRWSIFSSSICRKAVRQDSGDPILFAEKTIRHYKSLRIDPTAKTIIFSDGLKVDLENHILGLIAVLFSAIMQGLAAVVVKKWGGYLNPFSMNGPPLLIAGISMIFLSLIFEDSTSWVFNQKAILSISYLAVFGTIGAFTVYYWLLQRINAVILSLSSFITPIIALLLGWFILDEKLSEQVLMGTLFVLMGILFGNFNGLKKYYLSIDKLNL